MTDADLETAWAAVHEAAPPGWYVGRPGFEERFGQWSMYAFDPSEKPVVGKRSRECEWRHSWFYRVQPDGTVSLLFDEGDE